MRENSSGPPPARWPHTRPSPTVSMPSTISPSRPFPRTPGDPADGDDRRAHLAFQTDLLILLQTLIVLDLSSF